MPWFRTFIALREDFASGQDFSQVTNFSGNTSQALLQPKGSLIFGPWAKTELYLSAGRGFHSNDLRGVLGTVPGLGITNSTTPLLTKITSEEIGVRSNFFPGAMLTAAVFREDFDLFLSYNADDGVDELGPPARLQGIELSAQYRPCDWIEFNADVNFTHSRYNTGNPAAFDISGLYIPNSPVFVGSFGVIFDNLGPWYGGAQLRWLGEYPLVEDNSLHSPGYKEVNVDVGYKITEKLRVRLSIFNLFNSNANATEFAYQFRTTPTGPAVFGTTYHPLEPISARLTLTALF